ncbi:hypothetical protein LWI29_012222 [Acer saccharum]|uniref:Uncharacterized protein n=1 Tax=Acer saccharum TaxID=4024 RepID=A0AA39VQM0_ACESA|nr:hypothetical protein LWI29_012222 [Acer saccharum]
MSDHIPGSRGNKNPDIMALDKTENVRDDNTKLQRNKLWRANRISFLDIFKVVELTCDKHRSELVTLPSLEDIIHYDSWARVYAASLQLSSNRSPVPAAA